MRGLAGWVVLVAVAVSCGVGREGDSLDLGETPMALCAPAPAGQDVMFGNVYVRNVTDQPVTLLSVELVDPQDLVLEQAWLYELADGEFDTVGVHYATDTDRLPEGWDDRVNLEGVTLQPGAERHLAIVVATAPDPLASAQAIEIEYEVSYGNTYRQQTLTAMLVTTQTDCGEALSEFEF